MTTTTEALARAWADLPPQLQAHPGIKALHRAALSAIDALPEAPSVEPVAQDGRIETLAMMLRKCAHALKVRGRDDLAADVVGLLRRFDLLGSPLRATPQAQPATPPAVQAPAEPITVEAVAEVVSTAEGLKLQWLIEGGICALEEGCVLVMPSQPITDDDGSGEVYRAGAAAQGGEHV